MTDKPVVTDSDDARQALVMDSKRFQPPNSHSYAQSHVEAGHACTPYKSSQVVNGIRFDLLSSDDLVQTVQSFVDCGRSHVVHFLAVDPTVRAGRDSAYRAELNESDLNIADGQPIAWAVQFNGKHTQRIAGTDAFALLCAAGLRRCYRHYLYGSTPSVVERLEVTLRERHCEIRIVGAEAPPMGMPGDQDLASTADRIRELKAELVWIGIGTPNQHHVASRLRDLDAAPVILCIGAAFDFASDTKQRAPKWMQKAGLEWCHRLLSEPRRLAPRYLLQGPSFITAVAREYIHRASK